MCMHMCVHIPKYINTTFLVCVMLLICNIMCGFRTDDLRFGSNWCAFLWENTILFSTCFKGKLRSSGLFPNPMRCLFVVVQIMIKQLEKVPSRIMERKIIKAKEQGICFETVSLRNVRSCFHNVSRYVFLKTSKSFCTVLKCSRFS